MAQGGGKFLIKRLLKLVNSLWPFLLIVAVVYLLFNIKFSVVSLLLNFAMLGWFAKLPELGHLWFVTMIMACYVMFFMLDKWTISTQWKLIVLLVICFPLQFLAEYFGFPGYFFLVLLYCGVAYLYANRIILKIRAAKLWVCGIIALLLNVLCFLLIVKGVIEIGNLEYYYVTCLSGISCFVFLFKLFEKFTPCPALVYISCISYELYLVHHPLCNVRAITEVSGSIFLSVVVIVLASVVGAVALKKIADKVALLTDRILNGKVTK